MLGSGPPARNEAIRVSSCADGRLQPSGAPGSVNFGRAPLDCILRLTPVTSSSHPLLACLPIAAGAVRLRALRADDLEAFLAYRSDPEVARFQGWEPMEREAALAFLQTAAPPPWGPGEWAQIGIARLQDDRLVGDIGLLRETALQVQVGFSLNRAAQGRGVAQSAVGACLQLLQAALGIRTARAITDERNQASRRLLDRLGFIEVAREHVVVRGEACVDIVMHKRLRA